MSSLPAHTDLEHPICMILFICIEIAYCISVPFILPSGNAAMVRLGNAPCPAKREWEDWLMCTVALALHLGQRFNMESAPTLKMYRCCHLLWKPNGCYRVYVPISLTFQIGISITLSASHLWCFFLLHTNNILNLVNVYIHSPILSPMLLYVNTWKLLTKWLQLIHWAGTVRERKVPVCADSFFFF